MEFLRKNLLYIFLALPVSVLYSQSTYVPDTLWLYGNATKESYGRDPKNPIRIGFGQEPVHIYRYLNNLTGPTGNHVNYTRLGNTDTIPNQTLTVFSILKSEGPDELLYFDNYAWETPLLITGYGWKEKREEYYGEYANDTDTLGTGKGIYFYPDGTYYRGEWLQGVYQGFGIRTYPDGSRYEGTWNNGKREGFGKLFNPPHSDIQYMEGNFVADKRSGKFKIVKRDGSVSYSDF